MQNAEHDLWLMSAVIFLPSLFALVLMIPWIFPKGWEESMRWWSLLGTAVTLTASMLLFFDYHRAVYHGHSDANDNRSWSQLRTRADEADDYVRRNPLSKEMEKRPALHTDCIARVPWIPRFNIEYFIGVDGISLPLILMTTVLCFLAMLASWKIDKFVRGYCILFLILETGMLGTFFALDFFLFYVFWEVMLLPMYFLIGVWGGPRREYAAIKFFLYTLLGSVFILIAMLGFYFTNVRDFVPERIAAEAEKLVLEHEPNLRGAALTARTEQEKKNVVVNTFDLVLLQKVGEAASGVLKGTNTKKLDTKTLDQPFFTKTFQIIMFLLLFVGFAIKVPVFPFHTWLPDAHVEAPTPISMILAGVLLKLGGYGIIRIAYPICPWAAETLAMGVATFGVINIVYGAFAAMAQTDFKKLVAYSSVSHMGYVILGVAVWSAAPHQQYWSWAMNGAMFQMIAHGITSAGMFFLVGVIYDRAHHRNLDNFRGLYEPMPLYGGISAIIFFAAMGLPGMCGFVGEFMVILGTWYYSPTLAILAALAVVLTAAYILWTLQRVYFGQNPTYKDLPDITLRELACIVPLIVFAVLLGVMPDLLLSWMEPTVAGLVGALAHLGK